MLKRGMVQMFLLATSVCVAHGQIPTQATLDRLGGIASAGRLNAFAASPMDSEKECVLASLVYPKEWPWTPENRKSCRELWI
jgi:hypothetical protein